MSLHEEPWDCPRCGRTRPPEYASLSRLDNKTEICTECGNAEAMEDHMGPPGITPKTDWPVVRTQP